ncbi:MAG: sulfotransferase [Halioglobus sp.]|nr:sulfotransferase [Halioglobus sp.]
MAWNPEPQPRWVDAIKALGDNLGDSGRSMVSLEQEYLLASAAANTGLEDFGDDWFREPLGVLLRALEEEAQLTLVGRLLARAEIQRILQNRLRVQDVWSRHPEILEEQVTAPVVITGLGRSGTTLLHELLAQDPDNRVLHQWEAMYSAPPPERESFHSDARIAAVERELVVMDECDPAFPAMHELGPTLPTECIYIFAHQFATDKFTGEFFVPSYAIWNATHDLTPAYDYHRRFLKMLQWRNHGARWVLKTPSFLNNLGKLYATYPDARVVIAHRDPLRVIGSLANLMGTLQRMRSDQVNFQLQIEGMAAGFAAMLERMTAARHDGALAGRPIVDVRYSELVADPLGTVERLYEGWGLSLSADARRAMARRLAQQGHGQRAHRYRFEDTGLDREEERARFARYMAHYELAEEV